MKSFSQLKIKINHKQSGFVGNKIEVSEVFNEEIAVHAFEVTPSKYPRPGRERCLKMQIEINNEKRVMFLSAESLISVLEQLSDEDFPFKTVIKKNQKRFEFT